MNLVLNTQVTTIVTQVCDDQATVEAKPTKKQKIQITASQTPTIDVIYCDTKEEVHSSMHAIEEVTEHSQKVIDFFNNNEMEDSISNPRILESTFVSDSSTSPFLLSSIQTLSTFPAVAIPSTSLFQVYRTLTTTPASLQASPVQDPMLPSTIAETRSFKVPL